MALDRAQENVSPGWSSRQWSWVAGRAVLACDAQGTSGDTLLWFQTFGKSLSSRSSGAGSRVPPELGSCPGCLLVWPFSVPAVSGLKAGPQGWPGLAPCLLWGTHCPLPCLSRPFHPAVLNERTPLCLQHLLQAECPADPCWPGRPVSRAGPSALCSVGRAQSI